MLRVDLRSAFSRSLAAFTVAAAVVAGPSLVGCSYTHHYGVMANGASSQLYFTGYPNNANEPLAVGYAAKVRVQRFGATDVDCSGVGLHKNDVSGGGLHIQGGTLPDPDSCNGRPADAASLVSAACADDTCSVTSDTTDPRAVVLSVTGAHAGVTSLIVSLKSGADGQTYQDSISIRFEAPTRIRLAASARRVPAMKAPVLPGVTVDQPRAAVVDANGEVLDIDTAALTNALEGNAYEASPLYDGQLVAKRSGHTVLRWTYPGVPDRTVDLEVVDPSEARALYVYAPLPYVAGGTTPARLDPDPADVQVAPEPATGRITSIELVENSYDTYPFRVKLADGRLALGKLGDTGAADAPELTPAELGTTMSGFDLSAFDLEAKVAGQGTITLRAAPGATLTLPVKVTARPPR